MLSKIKKILSFYFPILNKKNVEMAKLRNTLDGGERFDPLIINEPGHILRYQFSKLFINKSESILDIACGTGYGTKYLSYYSKNIVGIDNSEKAISWAKSKNNKNNSKYQLNDFFNINNKFDTVISFETIEHIRSTSFDEILLKFLNITDNRIIGSVPYNETKGSNIYHLWYDITESNFDLLKSYGNIHFYYQNKIGLITKKSQNKKEIQNLIFVFNKKNENTSYK